MRTLRARLGTARHFAARFRCDRRGAIAIVTALALPPLILVLGLGIDVSYWATQQVELQRLADVAALAGAARYGSTTNAAAALATAADVAELNGLAIGTRAGDGATILTDASAGASATITFVAPAGIGVSVQRNLPLLFAQAAIKNSATHTVEATAQAQATPQPGQACVLGLGGISNGVTTGTDITLNGNPSLDLTGCDLQSDGSMIFNGNVTVIAGEIGASGTATSNGNVHLTPSTPLQGLPQVRDPLAATYGAVLAMPSGNAGSPKGMSINPPPAGQAYSSLSFNGNGTVALAPGAYYVAGNVTFNGNLTVNGSGVTLIVGGTLTINGNTTMNLTAPSSGPTAGLLLATTGSSLTLNGNAGTNLAGAIYVPNGGVTFNGNIGVRSSCLVAVAQTFVFNGNEGFADAGCAALGAPPVYDRPPITRLVQ